MSPSFLNLIELLLASITQGGETFRSCVSNPELMIGAVLVHSAEETVDVDGVALLVEGALVTPRLLVEGALVTPRLLVEGALVTPRLLVEGALVTPRPLFVVGKGEYPA